MRLLWTTVLIGLSACSASSSLDAGTIDLGSDAGSARDTGADGGLPDVSVGATDADVDGDVGPDALDFDATTSLDGAIGLDGSVPMDSEVDGAVPDASVTDASVGDGSVWSSFTTTFPDDPPIAPATSCVVTRGDTISRSALHVPVCSVITTWETNPPCHGDHYPIWSDYETYDAPVPWGFLVHDMEHGAVVFAYSCGAACATELQAFIDSYPADPLCASEPWRNRMTLVPEPDLPAAIVLASWGHLYTATCFDLPSIQSFVDDTYETAPEDFCDPGIDLSAAPGGWCPPDAGVDGG